MTTRTDGSLELMNNFDALVWMERRTMEQLDRFEIQTNGQDL